MKERNTSYSIQVDHKKRRSGISSKGRRALIESTSQLGRVNEKARRNVCQISCLKGQDYRKCSSESTLSQWTQPIYRNRARISRWRHSLHGTLWWQSLQSKAWVLCGTDVFQKRHQTEGIVRKYHTDNVDEWGNWDSRNHLVFNKAVRVPSGKSAFGMLTKSIPVSAGSGSADGIIVLNCVDIWTSGKKWFSVLDIFEAVQSNSCFWGEKDPKMWEIYVESYHKLYQIHVQVNKDASLIGNFEILIWHEQGKIDLSQ